MGWVRLVNPASSECLGSSLHRLDPAAAVLADPHPVPAGCLDLDPVAVQAVAPVVAARTACHPGTGTPGTVPAADPGLVEVAALGPVLGPDLVRAESILGDRSAWVVAPGRIASFARESGRTCSNFGLRRHLRLVCSAVRRETRGRRGPPRRQIGKRATCSWFNLPLQDGCELKDSSSSSPRFRSEFRIHL